MRDRPADAQRPRFRLERPPSVVTFTLGAVSVDLVTAAVPPTLDARVIHAETFPARAARFGRLATPLPVEAAGALAGVVPDGRLWTHQAEAIDHLRAGRSTVIATGTASGKSLCYQVPIAEATVVGIRPGTALVLYPTKALAHDQLRSFGAFGLDGLVAATYDGDTPRSDRSWIRERATTVLTNPEMLHHGILPHHQKWATFLKRLDYVVIDELHVLRGVFGTHVGHLLRRLRRLCALHGSDPTFCFTSATIGSPADLAAELCGKPVVAVSDNGAPTGERVVSLVQPAEIDAEAGRRQSPTTEAIRIVVQLVRSGRRVITFCGSRSQTERVAAGVARALPPELADTVRPYRSGYLAAERREIEEELASGAVRAVVTTSALELGVDIGGLDATVLVGFPGTIASFWQQVGRAGRAGQRSEAVLIAGEDQLDQWFVHHPDDLFSRPPEPAVVNLANPQIGDPHLGCAAFEQPLFPADERFWPGIDDGVRRLVLADELRIRPDRRRLPRAVWGGRGMPFHRIGLRSASSGVVRVVADDGDGRREIGTVEADRAAALVHPGAIYLHRGTPWRVASLDLDHREAVVEPADDRRWTQARTAIDLQVLSSDESRTVGTAELHRGRVEVTTAVTGYREFEVGRRSPVGRHDLDLPPQTLQTTGVWYEWDPGAPRRYGIDDERLPGALHAAEHGAIGILPLFAICDRWDVGGVSIAAHPQSGKPSIFIYDGYPGGAGIAELAFHAADRHLAATMDVIDRCPCRSGCPSCVQSPKCGNGNEPLDKAASLALLQQTLGIDEPF